MTNAQTKARTIAQDIVDAFHPMEDVPARMIADVAVSIIATALAAKDAELASLREFERQHNYCCCGDRMEAHNIGSGHAPVSVFDYEYGRAVERAERAEAQLAEARKALNYLNDAIEVGLPDQEISRRAQLLVPTIRTLGRKA